MPWKHCVVVLIGQIFILSFSFSSPSSSLPPSSFSCEISLNEFFSKMPFRKELTEETLGKTLGLSLWEDFFLVFKNNAFRRGLEIKKTELSNDLSSILVLGEKQEEFRLSFDFSRKNEDLLSVKVSSFDPQTEESRKGLYYEYLLRTYDNFILGIFEYTSLGRRQIFRPLEIFQKKEILEALEIFEKNHFSYGQKRYASSLRKEISKAIQNIQDQLPVNFFLMSPRLLDEFSFSEDEPTALRFLRENLSKFLAQKSLWVESYPYREKDDFIYTDLFYLSSQVATSLQSLSSSLNLENLPSAQVRLSFFPHKGLIHLEGVLPGFGVRKLILRLEGNKIFLTNQEFAQEEGVAEILSVLFKNLL